MLENRSTFTGVEQAIVRDNPFSAMGTNTEGLLTSRECIESANLECTRNLPTSIFSNQE